MHNLNLTFELSTCSFQDISSLIGQSQRSRAPLGYRCDKCGQDNTCDKVDLISGLADVLIINLKIFTYDPVRNIMTKVVPNLNINQELNNLWGNWALHCIIYHEGLHANNGHYTCGVNMNKKPLALRLVLHGTDKYS